MVKHIAFKQTASGRRYLALTSAHPDWPDKRLSDDNTPEQAVQKLREKYGRDKDGRDKDGNDNVIAAKQKVEGPVLAVLRALEDST